MDFRFAVLMIHRNDRPLFLEQFHRLMAAQTIQPTILEIVDFEPTDDQVDITKRYRYGYDKLRNQNLDCILFMEVDDFYLPNYIETMLCEWVNNGCPDMFGTSYTTYYHLKLDMAFTFQHKERSSMMSTLMKADLDFEWPADNFAYTDLFLWMNCKNRKTFFPKDGYICLGLKGGHGNGLVGGSFHTTQLKMYKEKVNFKKIVGEEHFNFYRENFPLAKTKMEGRELVLIE